MKYLTIKKSSRRLFFLPECLDMAANTRSDEEHFGQVLQQYVQQQYYINLFLVWETIIAKLSG